MVQGKQRLALFQNSNFLILEHWPKFNTDTNINFLGGQNMSGELSEFLLKAEFLNHIKQSNNVHQTACVK